MDNTNYDHYLFATQIPNLSKPDIKTGGQHKEYKKYRKQIFNVIKDIMRNKCDDKHVVEAFHMFSQHIIEYLKFKKLEELMKDDYKDLERTNKVSHLDQSNILNAIASEKLQTIEEEYNSDDTKNMQITMNRYGKNNMEDSNKLLFKKHTPNTMRIEDCIPIQIIQKDNSHNPQNTLHTFIPKKKNI